MNVSRETSCIATPAELVAASLCWLARQRDMATPNALGMRLTTRHPGTCRFCTLATDELMTAIRATQLNGEVKEFERLPRHAQYARVKEAQEPAWWEGIG
jgi:hypothetical protein